MTQLVLNCVFTLKDAWAMEKKIKSNFCQSLTQRMLQKQQKNPIDPKYALVIDSLST